MNPIYVCFNLRTISSTIISNNELDKDYSSVYKPLAKFLYAHQNISFSLSLNGIQLQYYKKRRNELITIVKQLIERKQVEILGGGFYDPILPLLYPVDRNGQIDKLNAEIRQIIGRRPRGITLFEDCWDSSLVNSLQTCGIEYILLDSSIIPTDKRKFLPLYMSDLGKSIEILPYYENFLPENLSVEEFVNNIVKQVEKVERKDNYCQLHADRVVNINLTHSMLQKMLETNWLLEFSKYLENHPESRIKTSIPYDFIKTSSIKVPAYIPAGISSSISKWIGQAFTEVEHKQPNLVTVHDFMNTYPQSHGLYNRIMYVSLLVNQYKSDKQRKNNAREKLWQAQNGNGLLCTSKGVFSNSKYRQQCYKFLMEAEKILREDSDFKETVSCFDYNGDGINEYVCRMANYFSYIDLTGGAIQELDILKNTGNYADNLSRYKEYDQSDDLYERGLFIDHLFSHSQFEDYLNGKPAGNGVFSNIRYSELKYSSNRHEIQLSAEAIYQPTKQAVYLKKKYIINSTGMNIQYILKNNSDKPLKAVFVIESNFAHTNFEPENITYYTHEIVDGDNKIELDPTLSTENLNKDGKLLNVDIVRITDRESGISFGLEPNETSGYFYSPLIVNRPASNGENIIPVNMTFISSLFWNIEIEPGKETERTINFTITAEKKGKFTK